MSGTISKIVAALIDEKAIAFEELPYEFPRFYKIPKIIRRKRLDFLFQNFTDSSIISSDGKE